MNYWSYSHPTDDNNSHVTRIPLHQQFCVSICCDTTAERSTFECNRAMRNVCQCNGMHKAMLQFFHYASIEIVEHSC